jgi:hypothetical protein
MYQLPKLFSAFILSCLSINFYLISKEAAILQESISGKFNSFQLFVFELNNYSSALSPLLIFIFIYATTSIIFEYLYLEIKKQKASLAWIISIAFIPILIFSFSYLLLLTDFVENAGNISGKGVEDLHLFQEYTFRDIKQIGNLFWGLFYLILIVEIKLNYDINYFKSLVINLTPIAIMLLLIKMY